MLRRYAGVGDETLSIAQTRENESNVEPGFPRFMYHLGLLPALLT